MTVAPASHAFLVLRFGITEEGSFFALLTGSADDLPDGTVARTSAETDSRASVRFHPPCPILAERFAKHEDLK